jgi:hypothetical protein
LAGRMGLAPLLPLSFSPFKVAPVAINRRTPFSHGSDSLSRYPLQTGLAVSNFGVDV